MEDVRGELRPGGEPEPRQRAETLVVTVGHGAAAADVVVHVAQVDAQDGGLQGVEAGVATDGAVVILGRLTVVGQTADALSQLAVGGEDSAPVAIAGQRLGGEEGRRADVGDGACLTRAAVGRDIVGSERLGVVLDDAELILLGHAQDRIHVARLSEEVNDDDGLRLSRHGLLDECRIDVVRVRTYIDKHRRGAQQGDHLGGGDVGKGGHNDLVARLHAKGTKGQLEGVGTVGAGDDVRCADILLQFAGEGVHLRATDEAARSHDVRRGLIDFGFQAGVTPLEVYHLNRFHKKKLFGVIDWSSRGSTSLDCATGFDLFFG